MLRRRTAVYIVPSEIVGHDLIFRHYTNKVVVGKYPETKMPKALGQLKNSSVKRNSTPR